MGANSTVGSDAGELLQTTVTVTPPRRIVLVIVALLIQLALSGYSVLGSIALTGKNKVNPYVFALYREILASLLMGCAAVYFDGRDEAFGPIRCIVQGGKGATRTFLLFLATGLMSFGTVVGTVVALNYIPSDVFSMMQPSIPVFTTAIALIFGYERHPNSYIFVGITASVTGAVLVEVFDASSTMGGSLLGYIVVVGQCLCTGTQLVLTKPLTEEWSPLVVTAAYYTIGSIFTVIVCIAAQLPKSDFLWTAPEPWAALVYSVVISSFFVYEAFSWLVARSSPTFTAAFIPMQPVFTILLNFLILGDGLGAPTAIAGVVVIIGLMLTVYGKFTRDNIDFEIETARPCGTPGANCDPITPDQDAPYVPLPATAEDSKEVPDDHPPWGAHL